MMLTIFYANKWRMIYVYVSMNFSIIISSEVERDVMSIQLVVMLHLYCLKELSPDKNRPKLVVIILYMYSSIIYTSICIQGPEIDDEEESNGEDVPPFGGIDDGLFDESMVPDGREKVPIPEKPRTNGTTPRKDSVPALFPYSPPDYGGPGVVMSIKLFLNQLILT